MSVPGFKDGLFEVVEGNTSKQDTVGELSDFAKQWLMGLGSD